MNLTVKQVTDNIAERSAQLRAEYLEKIAHAKNVLPAKNCLSCGNLAHAVAASPKEDKLAIAKKQSVNIGIVTSFNDMLSAHQPFEAYPQKIKALARQYGATAQVAGAVPAMCDGVTQGQPGMDLSLLSREVIAMSTAIGLSHNVFDAVVLLGVCDKIVPGMLMGALEFGHLPTMFISAGPMPSGISNKEKAAVREQYAKKEVGEIELFDVESKSYHSAGTCTFYGTANSNQLMMEILGVQVAASAFVNANTELRDAINQESINQLIKNLDDGVSLADIVTEKSIVNALVGLLASGGSTNHAMHIIAIARSAGFILTLADIANLSAVTPLLARMYPNGSADVNHFRQAGGIGYMVSQLRLLGLLNEDVQTIGGQGLEHLCYAADLDGQGKLLWHPAPRQSLNEEVLANADKPFAEEGGISVLTGNLGTAIVKTSAVESQFQKIEAPCRVFESQHAVTEAFQKGELDRDVVVVVRFQGPRANGMPELHKLVPSLSVLQKKGHRVALLTDGRMSGASGVVLSAIHLSPEALDGGIIGKLRDGDIVSIDATTSIVKVDLSDKELGAREMMVAKPEPQSLGRHLFENMRASFSAAEKGASVFF